MGGKRKTRILVVDDEERIRKIVGDYLQKEGYDVLLAESGSHGIHHAIEMLPDLIILDVMMPGIDGFETCRRIKRESNLEMIPIIFLTAKRGAKNWEEADEAGAIAYLEKPFRNDALVALIKEVLAQAKS